MRAARHAALFVGLWALAGLFATLARADEPQTGPWNLAELQATPQVEWQDATGLVRGLYYTGEPYRGKPTRVFAYYARPENAAGKLPTMILIHGGGGTAFRQWAELWAKRGYAALAMDLAGRGPDGKPLADGGPDQTNTQKFSDLKHGVEHAWTYQAVANVIRGVSLVQSFEEVDLERIGVTGISWGGYLTSIVAGVDSRLKVAVPVYGCGFLRDNSAWLDQFAQLPPEQARLWHEKFDPSQYLSAAKMPMLFVNGTNDFAYPLDSYRKSYRLVKSPRTLCVTVRMPHGHAQGWAPVEIGLFVDAVLNHATPLAQWGEVSRDGRQVSATFTSQTPIKKAELHFTTDTVRWQERNWKTTAAQLSDGKVQAELPVAENLAWFLTITDERGATVSTEHEELPAEQGSATP